MSAAHLPDDLSRWPESPYELLGVSHGVPPRDLRRAYTRLIRIYKPETHPEQFRRIREAYEAVLRYVELFGFYTPAEEEPEPSAPANDVEALPMPREVEDSDTEPPPQDPEVDSPLLRHLDPLQELHEIWEQACMGEEKQAYERLRTLHDGRPGDYDLCVRLYWLLAVAPEIDTLRRPSDWLFQGLRGSRLTGSLRELLRREVRDDPELALHQSYEDLCDLAATPGLQADLLEWRWQAAAKREQWQIIVADLDRRRAGFLIDSEEAWARLLLSAIDQLAWARLENISALLGKYTRELEQMIHLHTRMNAELDQLDLLLSVSADWRKLHADKSVPPVLLRELPSLLRLIPLSWSQAHEELAPALQMLLGNVAARPTVYLRLFDQVQTYAGSVLTQFGRLLLNDLQFREYVIPADECSEAAAFLTREFLDSEKLTPYTSFRVHLIGFCLRELIAPTAVARLSEDIPGLQALAQSISNDWPLRYLFLAYWAFHA